MAPQAGSGDAEARPDDGKRIELRTLPALLLVVVPSALLSAVVTYVLFAPPSSWRDARSMPRTIDSPTATPLPTPTPSVARGFHVNEAGGYAFRQPPGWTVDDRGSVSELVSPVGDLVISFGLGRPGTLEDAADQLVASIQRRYARVRVHDSTRSELAGEPARLVGGRFVNDAGKRVRFLGAAVRLADRNHVIGVFVADRALPRRVLPSVQEILGSLRTV
jgi:hypothetical protein